MRIHEQMRVLVYVLAIFFLAAWGGQTCSAEESASTAAGAGQAGTGKVRQALESLHGWLGDDDNAANWRYFVRSDELARELAKGNGADVATVQAIRAVYAGAEAGLDAPRFEEVRLALDTWLTELQTPIADLPAAIRGEKAAFRPVTAEQVAAARASLDAAVAELTSLLESTESEQAEKLKQAIDWTGLQAELQKSEGVKPDELDRLAALFKGETVGLEAAPFRATRRELRNYGELLRLVADAQLAETYARQLDELAAKAEEVAKAPKSADFASMARAAAWLERAGQASRIVGAIRAPYQRPNFYAEGSQALVEAVFDDPEAKSKLNEPQALQDNILGTDIEGVVYPNLGLSVQLVPSDSQAAILVQLAGAAASQSTGYRGPVTVFTNGHTDINASKYIYFDADGVTASAAAASCATSTTITGISARSCLVEKIAWKAAHKQKGQAEAIASSRAEGRIAAQVDREMGNRLAEAHQSYWDKVRNRLTRHDSFPRDLRISSTTDTVAVRVLHAAADQLAAGTEPPALTGSHDLSVRLHESAITNFGESLLGGETLTDERLVEILKENNVDVPEELQVTAEKDPWSITFSPEQPVSAEFAGNTVRLAIRGRRFTRGEQVVRADIEISANYKLEMEAGKGRLVRLGEEVSVEYVNRKQLSVGQVAMKTFLRKKFNALFKPTIPEKPSDGLKLPERLQSVGKLQLQQFSADGAWLTIGWSKAAVTETAAAETAAAPAAE